MASPSSSPLAPLLLLLLLLLAASISSVAAKISYSDHCGDVVPESPPTSLFLDSPGGFELSQGYFSGGADLLHDADTTTSFARFFYFHAWNLHLTQAPGVLKLYGTLTFQSRGRALLAHGRNLTDLSLPRFHRVRPRIPKTLYRPGHVSFELSGFWAESTGQLCMVGTGNGRYKDGNQLSLSAVFKLSYPKRSNITSSLVSGRVQSLDAADSPSHFEPITVLAYAQKDYYYTPISKFKKSCSKFNVEKESLVLEGGSFCSYLHMFLSGRFRLEYGNDCSNGNCGPFGRDPGFLPSFMSFSQIQCSVNGSVHSHIGFSNTSRFGHISLVPEQSLVAEGFWDQERQRACLMACRIRDVKDSLEHVFVGDCDIRLTLWFPAVLSIERRSTVLGRLWSNKDRNDAGYFPMVPFRSLDNNINTVHGLKYTYTKWDVVNKSCVAENDARNVGKKRFPDGTSVEDMRFDITVRDTKGRSTWGHATPLSIGETFYGNAFMSFMPGPVVAPSLSETNHTLLNVSYTLSYAFLNASLDVSEPTEISAEGVYNSRTGMLCMVGCRYQPFSGLSEKLVADSMDCTIIIHLQLSPLNPEPGEHLNGTIRSTRKESEPLYFGPLEVSSYGMYTVVAAKSIWRMDIEITMVLVSLTLSCAFIVFQLFYVNKNPDVLPSISIMMLVILTLGHMIPLVLNFEALFFMNWSRQNFLLWSGGWLEVNEVLVRVMTMVAFLLQCRLFQVVWSARSAEGGKKGLWTAERKTLWLCWPLYFIGAVIAWFVHLRLGSHETQLQGPDFTAGHPRSLWEDLLSYAGLILDGFLLPQIILNMFWNSKDKALSPIFYVGTTVVRAMPHLYDAFRAHHYLPHFNSSYIYASPEGDFYSSAWDIIIPLEGALFAVLIYLQQRFGGCCILPPRFRKYGGYETVPAVGL